MKALYPRRLVVVPCGGKKLERPAAAGKMYVGSYHRLARRAAAALAGDDGQVLILSAKHGLLTFGDVIEPYEQRLGRGRPAPAFVDQVRTQAARLGIAGVPEVTVLAGQAYADVVSAVWPHAQRPLDGCRGIGDQQARLAAIARA